MKNRIKQIRIEANLTQQQFADRLKTSRNNIAGYELGNRTPSDAAINNICREFNVNEEWLRTGNGLMNKIVSYDEEVAMYTQDILDDVDSDFAARIRDFIVLYGKLDVNSKNVLNNIVKEMYEMKKSRDES